MSFLQELLSDLTLEHQSSNKELDVLLDYAIEASLNDMQRNLGFIDGVEEVFNKHFASGDESFENYQSYVRNVELLLLTTGIDLPAQVLTPSFESLSYNDYSTEAEDKKDNIIVRAAKAFWAMLGRFADFIFRRGKKTEADADGLEKDINSAIEKAVIVEARVSKDKDGTKTTEIKLTVSGSYVADGKLSFKKRLSDIKATNLDGVKAGSKTHELPKSDTLVALPALEASVSCVQTLKETVATLKTIDLAYMRKVVKKYSDIKNTIEARKKDLAASIQSSESKLKSISNNSAGSKKIATTNKHGLASTTTTADVKSGVLTATLNRNKEDLKWAQVLYPAVDKVMNAYSDIHKVVLTVNAALNKV